MPGPSVGPRPTRGSLRWLRGGCVGLATTGVAAAGHVAAGGGLPPTGHLTVLLLGSIAVGVPLSGRRWGLPSLLTVLLGAQVVLHVGFAHTHHAATPAAPPAPMVLAHLAAAALTAWGLRRAEDWCFALVDLLATPWRVTRLEVAPVRTAAAARPRSRSRRLHSTTLDASVRRRGPPVPVAA